MADLPFAYDETTDTLTIHGIHYAMSLFREMSSGPIGGTFRIVSREDGMVTLQTIPASDDELRSRLLECEAKIAALELSFAQRRAEVNELVLALQQGDIAASGHILRMLGRTDG